MGKKERHAHADLSVAFLFKLRWAYFITACTRTLFLIYVFSMIIDIDHQAAFVFKDSSSFSCEARPVPLFAKQHARKLKRTVAQLQRLSKRFQNHPKIVHLKALERKIESIEFLLFLYFQNQSSLDHRQAVLSVRPLIMQLFNNRKGWFTFKNERFCVLPRHRKNWSDFWIKNKHPQRAQNHLLKGLGCGAPSSWWTQVADLDIKQP